MRVLIAGLWAATEPSGICRTVVNLIRGLNDVAPQVRISLAIGDWQQGYFAERLGSADLDVNVIGIHVPNRPVARNWWYLKILPRLARRIEADIVHLSFPAPVLRQRFRCPVVTTLHDLYPYDCPENFGFPHVFLNRAALSCALWASDRVACVSDFTRMSLGQHFPQVTAKKAVRINNAIALTESVVPTQTLVCAPYFLTVAQHRANKNLDLLLRSFHLYRSFADSSQNVKLVVVGMPGPETSRLDALVRQFALQDSVVFLSNISDGDLVGLYNHCELFITLSRIEGFGLPLGEALASGARVVASDIPAHRDLGGDHCEYVSLGGNDESVRTAEAFRRALLKPSSGTSVSKMESSAQVARQYLDLYRAVIDERVAALSDSNMEQPVVGRG